MTVHPIAPARNNSTTIPLTSPKAFLASLYRDYQGPITYDTKGNAVETDHPDFAETHVGDLYFQVQLPDQTAGFVWKVTRDVERDAWTGAQLEPTAVLYHPDKRVTLAFWALEAPIPLAELQPLADRLEGSLAAFLPTPGTEGWECVRAVPDRRYALGALLDVYGPEEPAEDSAESDIAAEEPRYFGDALIATPGYEPDADPLFARPITVSRGANSESKSWKPATMPLGAFLASLCMHKEGPKDGVSFIGGEVVGERRTQNAMRALYAVGLDVDVGMAGDELDAILHRLGCVAVRYTTHSNGTTMIEVSKDKIVKFAAGREIDTDVCRDYLRSVNYQDWIASNAVYQGVDHGERGIVVSIVTPPIPKNRVVIPFEAPFVIADEGKTQREAIDKWQKVPEYLAAQLGIPIDKTGKDASRLFFYPRHKKGRPFEATIFGGALFDWRSLDLDDPFVKLGEEMGAKGPAARKSKTDHGLGEWSRGYAHGFQIMDVLEDHCPDKIRSAASSGSNIECPFDEQHSNAGDPEDQACYAVNAGEGKSEIFTIKCQHDTCRDLTGLDHLGKMIKDGWFGEEVLRDERYNAEDKARQTSRLAIDGATRALEELEDEGRVFDSVDAAIDRLKNVVAVVTVGNKTRYATRTKAGLMLLSKTDALSRFESFRVIFEDEEKCVNLPALAQLLKSEDITIFDGMDCDPTDSLPSNILNTWEGLDVQPTRNAFPEEACPLILDHIHRVISGGDDELCGVVMDFLAHMFQQPEQKPGFALVIIGPRGVGKTTLGELLCRAIGPKHSVKIAQPKHLTGAFNKHLASKLFVQCEEVTFGARRSDEGVLKDAITATRQLTEPKGFDAYEERSFARYILISNPDHAVPAGEAERRWCVLEAADPLPGVALDAPERKAYFDALYREAEQGGLEAFVQVLLDRDIAGFNRFRPPVTAGLVRQMAMSLSPEHQWVRGVLENGYFDTREGEVLDDNDADDDDDRPLREWSLGDGFEVLTADVQRSFNSHVRKFGGSTGGSGACLETLREFGEVEKVREGADKRRYLYRFKGGRKTWQDAFTKRFGVTFDADTD